MDEQITNHPADAHNDHWLSLHRTEQQRISALVAQYNAESYHRRVNYAQLTGFDVAHVLYLQDRAAEHYSRARRAMGVE